MDQPSQTGQAPTGVGISGTMTFNPDLALGKLKNLRKEIDALIQATQLLAPNREVSLVITKLQEARMWAGQACGNYNHDAFRKSEWGDVAEKPTVL